MWGQRPPYDAEYSGHSNADQYSLDVQACSINAAAEGSTFRSLLLFGSCNIPESKCPHAAALVQSPLSEGSATSIHSDYSKSPKNEIIYLKSNTHASVLSAQTLDPVGRLSPARFGADNMDSAMSSKSSEWWTPMEHQGFSWLIGNKQAQISSSDNSLSNVGASGLHISTDLTHATTQVLDAQLQELASDLCRQEFDNRDGLHSEVSTGQLSSCCRSSNYSWDSYLQAPSRSDGLLSQQDLLIEGLQVPMCARLLSAESFLVKAEEIQSWGSLEKGIQAESSNSSLYRMHKFDGNRQNISQIHDHSGGAQNRPLDWERRSTSEHHKSLSCGSFSSQEPYCSKSDTSLSQIETQPSRINQEVDVDDFKRSIVGVRDEDTSLMPMLPLPKLSSNSEAPIQWVNPWGRLPDLLFQSFPSCSTSQSNSLASPMSRSEHCTQSPARVDLSKVHFSAQISSNFLHSHDEAAFNKNLGLTNNQVGDFFKDNTGSSSFFENPEQVLEPFFKKPRMELAPSIPFKKEKLGEKISALQQLVSPFGKTDTASVLLEAIGYIKFLHEQIQVLSMPYMKSTASQNYGYCTTYGGSEQAKDEEEPQQDLQSRGLCLVPVACTSQLTGENGADFWAPTIVASFR